MCCARVFVCMSINLNGGAFGTRSLPFENFRQFPFSFALNCFHSFTLCNNNNDRGSEREKSIDHWMNEFRAQFLPAFYLNIQTCFFIFRTIEMNAIQDKKKLKMKYAVQMGQQTLESIYSIWLMVQKNPLKSSISNDLFAPHRKLVWHLQTLCV